MIADRNYGVWYFMHPNSLSLWLIYNFCLKILFICLSSTHSTKTEVILMPTHSFFYFISILLVLCRLNTTRYRIDSHISNTVIEWLMIIGSKQRKFSISGFYFILYIFSFFILLLQSVLGSTLTFSLISNIGFVKMFWNSVKLECQPQPTSIPIYNFWLDIFSICQSEFTFVRFDSFLLLENSLFRRTVITF